MMNKRQLLFAVLVMIILFIVFSMATKPKDINWLPSYSRMDKIPYGTMISYELLEDYVEEGVINNGQPAYEFLADNRQLKNTTYLFLNDGLFFGDGETKKLMEYVGNGNTVIAVGKYISGTIMDTLGIRMRNVYSNGFDISEKPEIKFVNENLDTNQYVFNRDQNMGYFAIARDSTNLHEVKKLALVQQYVEGELTIFSDSLPNMVEVKHGDGRFILSTFPEGFTNYFLLDQENNHQYLESVLAYIEPGNTLYWDDYYKVGKVFKTSPLYYLFQDRSLKWAYYLAIIGSLLFVFFGGKRLQRAIKVVKPLPNKSIEFSNTIAQMYFDKGDKRGLALIMANQFEDYVRSKLKVRLNQQDDDYITMVAARSAHTKELVKSIVKYCNLAKANQVNTSNQLLEFNKLIEEFKEIENGK